MSHPLYGIEIEIDAGQCGQVAHIEQYGTPWVNHERMPISLPAVFMNPALCCSDNECRTFNRPCAQQYMPVRFSRGYGECGGHRDRGDGAHHPAAPGDAGLPHSGGSARAAGVTMRASILMPLMLLPLAACGPTSVAQAERECFERARLAAAPRGEVGLIFATIGLSAGVLVGLAAFVGHLYPVFFRFKGGKGVATAVGVLVGVNGLLALATVGTFAIVVYFSRYVSLASMVAAVFAPVFYLFGDGVAWQAVGAEVLCLAVMALLLVWRHRENINRLLAGTESKLGAKKA